MCHRKTSRYRVITFNDLEKLGRLGNQLFQVAATIGYAKKFGYDFGINSNWKYTNSFRNKLPTTDTKNNKIYKEPDVINFTFEDKGDDLSLLGYFQSERYFNRSDVEYYFRPLSDVVMPDNTCFIHFRRGDYLSLPYQRGKINLTLNVKYYRNAINHINKINNGCRYVVFSDDIKWCKDNIKQYFNLKNEITFEKNDDITDLFKMSQCDYGIVANSSFSWWGAWLGKEKTVLCPKIPFKHDIKRNGFYPTNWIKING